MSELFFGWLPDYPDFRDRDANHLKPTDNNKQKLEKEKSICVLRNEAMKKEYPKLTKLPSQNEEDLIPFFSEVADQENFNSCTAHAGTALIEYFENRTHGSFEKKSRMFLYKATRNLLNLEGDTGAFIRSTMKAMVLFGVPPESYWRYEKNNIKDEPPAFLYSFAQNYQTIQYYRLDKFDSPYSENPEKRFAEFMKLIKENILKGLPMMFGFTVYSNIKKSFQDGIIQYPEKGNGNIGGHAVVAIGYDDNKKLPGTDKSGKPLKGAIKIRNSWGTEWGEQGYGWLPYEYIKSGLTKDWWSIIKTEWIDSKAFE